MRTYGKKISEDCISSISFGSNAACKGDDEDFALAAKLPKRKALSKNVSDATDVTCTPSVLSQISEDEVIESKPKRKKYTKSNVKFSRKIKDLDQLKLLEKFFDLDPTWCKTTISYISSFMDLNENQLYKWGYDQKRKMTHKKGIRSAQRHKKMIKSHSDSVTDYNDMVDKLFPEEESVPRPSVDSLISKFDELKAKYLKVKDILNSTYAEPAKEAPKIAEPQESPKAKAKISPNFSNIKNVEMLLNFDEGESKSYFDLSIFKPRNIKSTGEQHKLLVVPEKPVSHDPMFEIIDENKV